MIEFDSAFGLLVQLPNNLGRLKNPDALLRVAEVYKCMKVAVVDPLCQVLMQPVGEMGFDIAVGCKGLLFLWVLEDLMQHFLQPLKSINGKFLGGL